MGIMGRLYFFVMLLLDYLGHLPLLLTFAQISVTFKVSKFEDNYHILVLNFVISYKALSWSLHLTLAYTATTKKCSKKIFVTVYNLKVHLQLFLKVCLLVRFFTFYKPFWTNTQTSEVYRSSVSNSSCHMPSHIPLSPLCAPSFLLQNLSFDLPFMW